MRIGAYAVHSVLGLICTVALSACATNRFDPYATVLSLKAEQTMADTDKDASACRAEVGLRSSRGTATQYAYAVWVPVLIQSVGQGAAQGYRDAQAARLDRLSRYHSCMERKGYKTTAVTLAEYCAYNAQKTDKDKETMAHGLYAKYHDPKSTAATAPGYSGTTVAATSQGSMPDHAGTSSSASSSCARE